MELLNRARDWKEKQSLITEKTLSPREVDYLYYASAHTDFLESIYRDPQLLNDFFKWVIRDGINPQVFIQYPELQKKLVASHLNGRIGRQGGDLLKVYYDKVTLPFEGVEYNILDPKQVIPFRGNYRLTVAQVLEIFKHKGLRVGNLEFMAEGITNWNVHRLGWWDATMQEYRVIDVDQPGWWKYLPKFNVVSLAEAQKMYGYHIDGVIWNVAATASRSSPSLDFEKTHAFLEVAIPLGDGRYSIYDFGKFAYQFPGSVAESLSFFCKTVHATVAYPDENVFYTHRQKAHHSFGLTSEQGFSFMEGIAEDIRRSREGNFVYQIESENCAKWSHEKIEAIVGDWRMPNLFRIHLLNTEPEGPCKFIFGLIKKIPGQWQTPLLSFLHLPFGASTAQKVVENGEIIERSLHRHQFWNTGVVYLPAFLLHQKYEGQFIQEIEPELLEKMVECQS